MVKGMVEKAYTYFQKALLIENSLNNTFNVAIALMTLNRYSEADKYLAKIMAEEEPTEIVLLAAAECSLMLRNWDEAEKHYQNLAVQHPQKWEYQNYLKIVRDPVRKEKYVLSKEFFNAAQLSTQKKDFRTAFEQLKEAEKIDPENPNIVNNIGSVMLMLGYNLTDISPYFERAVMLAPDNERYKKNLLYIKHKMK